MVTYRYLRADEWGIRWARPPIAEKLPDVETFVHHTAGGQLSPDAAQAFRLLNEYAITQKGYSALDYDVLVHYNPVTDVCTIGEGRGKWMSAATLDRNEQGEAVCVLGYFHPGHALTRHPHPAEVEGTARAIVWAIQEGWISSATSILGHRDNPAHPGATGCPGDYLQAELPTIRRRVAELLAPTVALRPHLSQEDNMELFTLDPIPAALYERSGGLVRWVTGPEFAAIGVPISSIRQSIPAGEAKRYRLLGQEGTPGDGARFGSHS